MDLPSLSECLQKHGRELAPVEQNFVPAKEFAQQIADTTPDEMATQNILDVRDQLLDTYEGGRVADLLTQYTLNRDTQMRTMCRLGKEPILSLMSAGVLPAEIAKELKVSYDTFHEYMRIVCNPQEIREAEILAADALVAEAQHELRIVVDKDDVPRAKALAEFNLKLAKTMGGQKYVEQKPQTAIQVNNTYEGDTLIGQENTGPQPYISIIIPNKEDLKPLPKHTYTAEKRTETFKPRGFEDGAFTAYDKALPSGGEPDADT